MIPNGIHKRKIDLVILITVGSIITLLALNGSINGTPLYKLKLYLSIIILMTYSLSVLSIIKNKTLLYTSLLLIITELVINVFNNQGPVLGYASIAIYVTIQIFLRGNRNIQVSNKDKIYVPILVISLFILSYYIFNGFTSLHNQSVLGDPITSNFLSGWDQSAYYRMVLKIVEGDWFPGGFNGGYYYGLGYPITAVPFYYLYPANPFLLLNLTICILSIYFFFKGLKKYFGPPMLLIIILLVLIQSPLNNLNSNFHKILVMPWNNLVSIAVSFIYFYFLFGKTSIKKWTYLALGLLLGWVFASRYGDFIFFIPLAIALLFKGFNYQHISNTIIKGLIYGLGGLLIIIPTLYSHKLFYGNWMDTYITYAAPDGHFFPFMLDFKVHFFKIIELFFAPVTGLTNEPFAVSGFLANASFIIFLPLGLLAVHKEENKKLELFASVIFIILNILYFTSTGATSAGQIKYHCLRYFCPIIPFIFFFSFYGLKKFIEAPDNNKRTNLLSLVGVVATISILIVTLISPNRLKPQFRGSPNMTVEFESDQEDFVSKEVHPINYVKDGQPDYKFALDINSFFPIKLNRINILFLDGKGETWVSNANRKAKSKLWGVGMVNEYGKNINFQAFGDNKIYQNNYLPDSKKIEIYIPIPYKMKGRFRFEVLSNKGTISEIVTVK